MKYYKILASDFTHNKHRYNIGYNEYTGNFDTSQCGINGFHFCKEEDIPLWLTHNINNMWIAEVTLCKDSIVVVGTNELKTNKFILSNFVNINDWMLTQDVYNIVANINGCAIQYVSNPTDELCIAAMNKCPCSISCIKYESEEVSIRAIKINPHVISLIDSKHQTPLVCFTAIDQNPETILEINNVTEELCIFAVKRCPSIMRSIQKQTRRICLTAVRLDGLTLCHVTQKTVEICICAMIQTKDAFKYVPNHLKDHGAILALKTDS